MARGPLRHSGSFGDAFRKVTLWISGAETDIATSPTITAGAGVPTATQPRGSLWLRNDGGATTTVYVNTDGAATWASAITTQAIVDTGTYYTTDTVDGAFDALGLQIAGDTDATFNFTEANVLADNDSIYPALEKLDLKWGDLASITNGQGASLVGFEDAATLTTAANVEAALAELYKHLTLDLADPGTGAAIPVTRSATIGFTTAAAETNTLAIPTFVGQRLILYVDTYAVGDRVVTVAAPFNVANNTILTFGAVSEACELVAVEVGGSLVWQLTWNDGVGLS